MNKKTINIVIAALHSWNTTKVQEWTPPQGYRVYLITDPEKLTLEILNQINPRYIFFPHWSTIIPKEIFSRFECVVFHMTDLPFGRGGSPLQNLIVRGIYNTKISALKVSEGLDEGPIYLKRAFNIKKGSAELLYHKASKVVFKMIEWILLEAPTPCEQQGKPTTFKRRKAEESRIPKNCSGRALYDFIRMLDAPGYPHAFIETEGASTRYEFFAAKLRDDGTVEAKVIISNPNR